MSQSPQADEEFQWDGGYAEAARQLNKLVRAGRSYSGHERNCCFLNVSGDRFANVSQVSGFDFAEDGRAVATCDWDDDGDLDCWIANRTAPQIRLLRNDLGTYQHSLQVRLQGTSSNRDAIGARVRVELADSQSTVLQKTLRVGEGFLACQSKRLHFGLGASTSVKAVDVRWPSGELERFGPLARVDVAVRLVEGSGRVQHLPPRSSHRLEADPLPTPSQTMATHNWLTQPAPVPALRYHPLEAEAAASEIDASIPQDRPTLINLWASWCQPCLVELAGWSQNFSHNEPPIRLVALSVESATGKRPPTDAKLLALLSQIGFAGEAGKATPQLLDTLQQLHNVIYDHHLPLPIPASFLLDQHGQLRAVYKGSVDIQRVLADVRALNERALNDQPPHRGLPFAGKWLGRQNTHNLSLLVEELFREGYEAEASSYVQRLRGEPWMARQIAARLFLAEQLASRDPATAGRHAAEVIKLAPTNAAAHERLALILARNGETAEALYHFQLAARHANPPNARTHFNFGQLLRDVKLHDQAIAQFEAALRINPEFTAAYERLGLVRASQSQFALAADAFRAAARLQPGAAQHSMNLAMAMSKLGKSAEAWHVVAPLVKEADTPPLALLIGAKSLEDLRREEESIALLEEYLQQRPTDQAVQQRLQLLRRRLKEKRTEP